MERKPQDESWQQAARGISDRHKPKISFEKKGI